MQAPAAQVTAVNVVRDGGKFLIDMHLTIDATAPSVFRVLQDYAAMVQYNPDLRSVRVEPTGTSDRVRLFMTVHACVLIFCQTMHQEQIMTATASANGGTLHAELVPHSGDFKGGHGLWMVRPCSTARARTCMDIHLEVVPAFWVPPVIGRWVLGRKMDEEASRTAAGLEQTARHLVALSH